MDSFRCRIAERSCARIRHSRSWIIGYDAQSAIINDLGHTAIFYKRVVDLQTRYEFSNEVSSTDIRPLFPQGAALNNLGELLGPIATETDMVELQLLQNGSTTVVGTLQRQRDNLSIVDFNDAHSFVVLDYSFGIGDAHAFVGAIGKPAVDIGSLGGGYTFAADMNNQDQVVGFSKTGATQADFEAGRAVDEAFLYENGQMRGLGTIAGPYSFARAINDLGQVVGESSTTATGAGVTHAFLYDETHGMRDIGNPGLISVGLGINNHSEVVGIEIGDDGTFHAFVYHATEGIQHLEHLIPADSGWSNLVQATSINNRGQIAGTGLYNGSVRAFVMTPVPEPAAFALSVLTVGWFVAIRRRAAIR